MSTETVDSTGEASYGAPVVGPPAVQRVAELGWGVWASAVVVACARLQLPDFVGARPVSAEELARKAGVDPDALRRFLRALTALGIFHEAEAGHYEHTEASRALRSDAEVSLRDIMLTGSHWGWDAWGALDQSVRTGECAVTVRYGKDLFTYFHEDDNAAGEACLRGYAAQARAMNPALVDALDVSGVRRFCDVGGGHGSLVLSLLLAHRDLYGVLFDRAPVLRNAVEQLRTGLVAARCALVVGDCFDEVPPADLYLLRQVVHMWDDDRCLRVLRNCARAGTGDTRIVLLEQLVDDPAGTPWDALMDLHMLLTMGGRERSAEEYADLFRRAGLEFTGTVQTGTPLRILEARVPR